jgi:acyl-CoA thioester hydrolase
MKRGWRLRRRVLPQHTDHAGVMWHGAYLGFLEEARVEALAAAGLDYSDLSARGLELPVVALSIQYRQALVHGEALELWSTIQPRRGLRLPWHSTFLNGEGDVAAEARVELVLVQLPTTGAKPAPRRLLRRLPEDLERAIERLGLGPNGQQEP